MIDRTLPVSWYLSDPGQKCVQVSLYVVSNCLSKDEVISQWMGEVTTVGLKVTLKPSYGEKRGLWCRIFVFLSSAKEFCIFGSSLGILLNQDRKLVQTWDVCSNLSGSASCGLQYSASVIAFAHGLQLYIHSPSYSHRRGGNSALCFTHLVFPISLSEFPALSTYWTHPCCFIDYF